MIRNKIEQEILDLLKSYEDNFELKDRHDNRKFFDFTHMVSNGDPWELGNRSGKYSMFYRLSSQILEIIRNGDK